MMSGDVEIHDMEKEILPCWNKQKGSQALKNKLSKYRVVDFMLGNERV